MITIGSNAFCCCRSNRSNRYTCPLHWLTLRSSSVWRGDIKVFAFTAPSSNDGYLRVMCESWNFESIFGPLAILHAHSRPRLQLHVSPSCRLRHVTKPTVTYMTDFWFCLRCHFSILEFKFANAVTSLLLTCVASVVDPRFKLIAFESTPTNGVRRPL